MILKLLLIHVLNSLNHNICRLTVAVLTTILRIIIIIDVDIIIVDDLNDFGGWALTQLHVTQTHCIQLSLKLWVIDMTTLRVVVIRRALLVWVILAIWISNWTAISRINSTNGFRV